MDKHPAWYQSGRVGGVTQVCVCWLTACAPAATRSSSSRRRRW